MLAHVGVREPVWGKQQQQQYRSFLSRSLPECSNVSDTARVGGTCVQNLPLVCKYKYSERVVKIQK
jgi:hypothetical protein